MRSESLLQTSSLANSGVLSFMFVQSSKRASRCRDLFHRLLYYMCVYSIPYDLVQQIYFWGPPQDAP